MRCLLLVVGCSLLRGRQARDEGRSNLSTKRCTLFYIVITLNFEYHKVHELLSEDDSLTFYVKLLPTFVMRHAVDR